VQKASTDLRSISRVTNDLPFLKTDRTKAKRPQHSVSPRTVDAVIHHFEVGREMNAQGSRVCASIINAAFTHAHPEGSRFNGPDRVAWYAARNIRTALDEVACHQAVALSEVGIFEDETTYDEYLADFNGEFHDLRGGIGFQTYLSRDSYIASQELAERLLADGSLGIVYPSVRHTGGECLVCFRPALVSNVRKSTTYRFRWEGIPKPTIEPIKR
jgi:hypothetical protein